MSSHVQSDKTDKIQDVISKTEGETRTPEGIAKKLLVIVPLMWAAFQIWHASSLPFAVGFGVFNDTEARSIHLAFALFLVFLLYPASKKSSLNKIPKLSHKSSFLWFGCQHFGYYRNREIGRS